MLDYRKNNRYFSPACENMSNPGSPRDPGSQAQIHQGILPLSKLRGVPSRVRVLLKHRRITNCEQLLRAAGRADLRRRLAADTGIDPALLLELVQRADLARIKGIGAVFGMMLENLGIRDIQTLAGEDAALLHARLKALNTRERLARRAPTPEEVAAWIEEARHLPTLVTY